MHEAVVVECPKTFTSEIEIVMTKMSFLSDLEKSRLAFCAFAPLTLQSSVCSVKQTVNFLFS